MASENLTLPGRPAEGPERSGVADSEMWGSHCGPCATASGRAVGVVGEVVEDGVPESRISDPIVATLRGGLAHRQCAAASAAVVEDPLSGGEARDERAVEAAGGLESRCLRSWRRDGAWHGIPGHDPVICKRKGLLTLQEAAASLKGSPPT